MSDSTAACSLDECPRFGPIRRALSKPLAAKLDVEADSCVPIPISVTLGLVDGAGEDTVRYTLTQFLALARLFEESASSALGRPVRVPEVVEIKPEPDGGGIRGLVSRLFGKSESLST